MSSGCRQHFEAAVPTVKSRNLPGHGYIYGIMSRRCCWIEVQGAACLCEVAKAQGIVRGFCQHVLVGSVRHVARTQTHLEGAGLRAVCLVSSRRSGESDSLNSAVE